MSDDNDLRVTDAECRAGPVISAIESLAGGRASDRDLERLAHADEDDLKAAVDLMAYAIPGDFDLTMQALSAAARLALQRGRT
jgi:hypothetical protein